MIVTLFWLCGALLFYVIAGYPLSLLVLAKVFGRDDRPDGAAPKSFTFLIAAHNEENCIRAKVQNALDLAASGHFEVQVIVVSDGSTDRTVDEVRAVDDPRVQLIVPEKRSGKALALNQILPLASGEVVIFTDANSIVAPGALEAMAERFSDPSVGGVCGEIRVDKASRGALGKGEGFYWRYDQAMKRAETRLGGAVSAQGSFYALRRECIAPFRDDCADDFYNSVRAVQLGYRLVFEPRVQAVEPVTERAKREMSRRIRSTERGWRALMAYKPLLNPLRHGWYAWQLVSHKLLRRMTPFILLAFMFLNLLLLGNGALYAWLGFLQLLAYGLVVAAALNARIRHLPGIRQLFFFALSNLAMAIGLLRYMSGHRSTMWNPVRE